MPNSLGSSIATGSRSTYVGPLARISTSSSTAGATTTSSSSPSTAKSAFLRDVADHAQSLVRNLKRRPYLVHAVKPETVVGAVGTGSGDAEPKSPPFLQLYDEEEGGKFKRIKVEESNLKVREKF